MPITEEILIATLLDQSTCDLNILQCSDDQKVSLLIQAASRVNQPEEIQTEENVHCPLPMTLQQHADNIGNLTKRQSLILKHSSHMHVRQLSSSNRTITPKSIPISLGWHGIISSRVHGLCQKLYLRVDIKFEEGE